MGQRQLDAPPARSLERAGGRPQAVMNASAQEMRTGMRILIVDDDDPFPALLDAGNILAQYFRHPRSLIRLLRTAPSKR